MKSMRLLPELVDFLRRNKYIYTVRRFRYSLTDTPVEIEGVGPCDRVHIAQICNKESLEKYVYASGFASIDDWWKKIKTFNKGYVGPYYLYEITMQEIHETT